MKTPYLLLAVSASFFLSGCATVNKEVDVRNRNESAAAHLSSQIYQSAKAQGFTPKVMVTSLVSVNDLSKSCELARISAEQISGCMTRKYASWGVVFSDKFAFWRSPNQPYSLRIAEPKTGNLKLADTEHSVIYDAGEFVLTRDISELVQPDFNVVVTGTYAVGDSYLMISLKAINMTTKRLVGSYNYDLPIVDVAVFPPSQWQGRMQRNLDRLHEQ